MNYRWWIYQKERFPLLPNGILILVFCLSLMLFSSLQHDTFALPPLSRIAGAFVSVLILFLQLRIADEFKDFDVDSRYRPERPVPSGLVGLRELAAIAYAGAAVQFVIAVSIDVGLVPVLVGVWLYLGLMTREFFVPERLRAAPLAYLFSHMLIMPLIAFYASAFDWLCDCRAMPQGLGWMLVLSFCCGLVIELGRKIRAREHERMGVETYSALWGTRNSLLAWVTATALAVLAFVKAATYVAPGGLQALLAAIVLGAAVFLALSFPRDRRRDAGQRAQKRIEAGSGLVTLALYAGLGPLQALIGQ